MTEQLDLPDIQGLLVRGYGPLPFATFLLLHVDDPVAARHVLSDWSRTVTSAEQNPDRTATNIAMTAAGIRQFLGGVLPAGFAYPFLSGMATPYRSRLLGDVDEDDPRGWRWGGPGTDEVHLLLLLYAREPGILAALVEQIGTEAARGGLRVIETLDTDRLSDREHFGFRDGISQPVIEGLPLAERSFDVVRAGEFILGYLNEYGQRTERPLIPRAEDPDRLLPGDHDGSGAADLGRNGSYLVFRQLRQDVDAFWRYMDSATRRPDGASDPERRDLLAAKFVGRWPDGAPLVLSPQRDDPAYAHENAFEYHRIDPLGLACPIGAHVRRGNPRDSLEPAPGTERSREVNRRHRILRRGRNYSGYDEEDTSSGGGERGVHFLCLNGNLARQYEFVQHSWVNDPMFNGLSDSEDPLIGARRYRRSVFREPALPVRRRYHDVPKFVRVRGGAYFFLPGISALRHIASRQGAR